MTSLMFHTELFTFFSVGNLIGTPALMHSKTFQPLLDEREGYLQLLQALLHLQGCLGNLVGPKIHGRIREVMVCLPAFKILEKQKSICLSSRVKPTKSLS